MIQNRQELYQQIQKKSSFLCVGLDPDISKLPDCLRDEEDPVFSFNRAIIEATLPYAVAYKPNLAFYEALGPSGWETLAKTMELMPADVFTIADAKRGDIGNTGRKYAEAFFEHFAFDSITVAPYMGKDSVTPFLSFEGKWAIVLGATSNPGHYDFQAVKVNNTQPLYENVVQTSMSWGSADNLMYVFGATQPDAIRNIRTLIPEHFLLVPGVGAQGGSLKEVYNAGANAQCGLLVNSSRSILYASSAEDFAEAAGQAAHNLQSAMSQLLDAHE